MLLIVGSLAGCRLYGGYDSAETIREEISVVLSEYRAGFERASQDLSRIERATGNELVASFAEKFRMAVEEHEEQLTIASNSASDALERGGYRKVSRALGLLVAQKTTAEESYRSVLVHAAESAGLPMVPGLDSTPRQAVPAYYQRSAGDSLPTVDSILEALAI